MRDTDLGSKGRAVFLMSAVMLVADMLMAALGLALSILIFGDWPRGIGLVLPAIAFLFYTVRLYPPVCMAPADELKRIALTIGLVFLLLLIFELSVKENPRGIAALCVGYPLCVGFILVGRWAVRGICSKKQWWGVPVVIIGAGRAGKAIADRLLDSSRIGLRPVMLFDDDPSVCGEYRDLPVVFGTTDATNVAQDYRIRYAIVAMPGVERERVMRIVDEMLRFFPFLMLVPDIFGLSSMWTSTRDLDGMLTLEAQQKLSMPGTLAVKRAFDLFIAVVGGLCLLPFILLLALCIKIDSRGPAFYAHERLGKNGAPFKAWKFRSMVMDAEKALADYLASDPELRREWDENFKLKNDPRITRVGRFLRKTSLDELPQLWNMLRGEMSFVGPRPIVRDEVAKYGSKYELFASVKPGVTGLWQISGRSDISYAERVDLDIYYVRNWSIWLDLYITLKTVLVVVVGSGAY